MIFSRPAATCIFVLAISLALGNGMTSLTIEQIHTQAEAKYGKLPALLTQDNPSIADWESSRAAIRKTLLKFLGPFPATRCELKPRVLREEKLVGYTRRKVRYLTQENEDVPAYLLIPDGATTGATPAIIAPHQTNEPAKEEICGIAGKPDLALGVDLVKRGYVVLAPDSITAGERIYNGYEPFETAAFDQANPEWSAMGKMLWDHMRGLDYLETVPEVDPNRIGAIGHSLGAYNAFFLAAFDDRVKAVVESCGYTTIASDPGRERWARTEWFVHFPKLRPYVEPGSTLTPPFDFHEVLAVMAPRPLYQSVGLQDHIFPTCDSAAQAHVEVQKVYKLYGKPQNLEAYFFDGKHEFPADSKKRAYDFFDRNLK